MKPEKICDIIQTLKTNPATSFEMMMDLLGMDYSKMKPEPVERYAVIYNLYSVSRGERVRVKVFLTETSPEIDSIHAIYAAANWFEREVWDLFGIVFRGHPNLTRILCHSDFEGHPLRKDYPSDGYQRLKTAVAPSGL